MRDGLPEPDAETFAALQAEAITARPKASDWAKLVAKLRWAVEVERRGLEAPGTIAPRIALDALIEFLVKQRCIEQHGAHVPLVRLAGALADLAGGSTPPLFKPTVRKAGNRSKSHAEAVIRGFSVRAAEELIESGVPAPDATRRVATALRAGKVSGWERINAATVENWRERIRQGVWRRQPVPGASQEAIDHYLEPLPAALGSSPKQRGEILLKILRERGRALTG